MRGLQLFKDTFSEYKDQYVVIGGIAMHVLLDEQPVRARVTKDIDMILLVEALTSEFVGKLWDFIREGGYESYRTADGVPTLYRFIKPLNDTFPLMIELFTRRNLEEYYPPEQTIVRVCTDEEEFSLSAILLDDDYYNLARSGALVIDGITVLGPKEIILFKSKAYLDLKKRKNGGHHVNSDDIKKHRTDVLRLATVVDATPLISINDSIRNDMRSFMDQLSIDASDLRSLGINVSPDDLFERLNEIYGLNAPLV